MMESQLLNTETKKFVVSVNNEVLTLTDKRLIWNEKFIGLNELRGADISSVPVKYEKFVIKDLDSFHKWILVVVGLISVIIAIYIMHPYKFTDYVGIGVVGIIGGMIFGNLAAIPVIILVKIYLASTSKTINRAWLKIEKTDNTYFINRYYDINKMEEIKELTIQLNSIIYQ